MVDFPNPIRTINPFTNDDIVFAPHRRKRPRGSIDKRCPLCEEAGNTPVIIPNKYPSLVDTAVQSNDTIAKGFCGVIIYSKQHGEELLEARETGSEVIRKILSKAQDDFETYPFVIAFENKGSYFGASLSHPHGQYWAMSWISRQQELYWRNFRRGNCFFCQSQDQDLVVYEDDLVVVEVSPYPLLPYELFIFLKEGHKTHETRELKAINDALRTIYHAIENNLGGRIKDSLIAWHLPPKGHFNNYHFHISIHVPHETPDKMKVFGGIEFLTKTYINSYPPEEVAETLRNQLQGQK